MGKYLLCETETGQKVKILKIMVLHKHCVNLQKFPNFAKLKQLKILLVLIVIKIFSMTVKASEGRNPLRGFRIARPFLPYFQKMLSIFYINCKN